MGESFEELDEFLGYVVAEEFVVLICLGEEPMQDGWRFYRDPEIRGVRSHICVYKVAINKLPPDARYCRYDVDEDMDYYQSGLLCKANPEHIHTDRLGIRTSGRARKQYGTTK